MTLELMQVDAFTSTPFAGNPAAVCFLAAPVPDAWMQQVAQEMNLSETAFLLPEADGYRLRWFTPAVEVDLCGHATLGSAHALWETGRLSPAEAARFYTRSGLLTCRQAAGWIEMDFPATTAVSASPPASLLDAIGIGPAWDNTTTFIGRNKFDYLLVLEEAAAVRALRPDFGRLIGVAARGIITTAPSDDPAVDFVSRFFAPAVGVPEDPVTGSAHTTLGPYWAARLGKTELTGYQASARGGIVRVRVAGDRVLISGQAVTVLKGQLLTP